MRHGNVMQRESGKKRKNDRRNILRFPVKLYNYISNSYKITIKYHYIANTLLRHNTRRAANSILLKTI